MFSLIPVESMRWLLLVWLAALLAVVAPARSQAGTAPVCDVPTDLITPSAPLTWVASALATKGGLNILAIGSGSTVGEIGRASGSAVASGVPESSFPYRMVAALQEMKPSLKFNLTVKGGRDMTAQTMLPILREELAAHHYDLVLWQTGTVEAVHGLRPDMLREELQEGTDVAEEAHADLVLVDPQFSRFLRANADLSPYETVLEQMTTTSDVTLFHRFDLTQGWVSSGQVDVERVTRDERDKTIAMLNECLGQALAQYVLAGASGH